MNATLPPPWWEDIRRSRENALNQYEKVLMRLGKCLDESAEHGEQSPRSSLEKWTAIHSAVVFVAEGIKTSKSLAESREADVAASGFTAPVDEDLNKRSAETVQEIKSLSTKIRDRLEGITRELYERRLRPRTFKTYRSSYPSMIDVRV